MEKIDIWLLMLVSVYLLVIVIPHTSFKHSIHYPKLSYLLDRVHELIVYLVMVSILVSIIADSSGVYNFIRGLYGAQ